MHDGDGQTCAKAMMNGLAEKVAHKCTKSKPSCSDRFPCDKPAHGQPLEGVNRVWCVIMAMSAGCNRCNARLTGCEIA